MRLSTLAQWQWRWQHWDIGAKRCLSRVPAGSQQWVPLEGGMTSTFRTAAYPVFSFAHLGKDANIEIYVCAFLFPLFYWCVQEFCRMVTIVTAE